MREGISQTIGLLLACAVLLTWTSAHSQTASPSVSIPPAGFVSAHGDRFVLDGKPFRVAGVNNHYLTYGYDEEVTGMLDDAVAMHANVVRIILQPVIGSLDGSVSTIWNWKGDNDSSNLGVHGRYMLSWRNGGMEINDGVDGLQRLDFVLAEARRRQIKVIVALLDFWGYTGGAQQMSAWYGSHDKYTFFAEDQRTRKDYKRWIDHVIRRQNSITGVHYSDDPTVFSWELMNEPDIQPQPLLLDWVREMSEYIKSIDPIHLVSTGHNNIVNRFADVSIPSVDFGTWHGYAGYENMSVQQFGAQIREFCALGARLRKPILLEEFGLAGSEEVKRNAYNSWINAVIDDQDCAGWVIWRLVSRQHDGEYPADQDGFDIRNDGGALWNDLRALATATRADSH